MERMRNKVPIQSQIISLEGHGKKFKHYLAKKEKPSRSSKQKNTCLFRKLTLAAMLGKSWRDES